VKGTDAPLKPSGGTPKSPLRFADQARTIRVSVHMIETINRLISVSRNLLQELGREPTVEEIAEAMSRGGNDNPIWPASSELAPPPTDFLTFDRSGDQAAGGASFRFAWLVRSRYDAASVSRMWARNVSRSTTTPASRGSVKVWPHSLNGALLATATVKGSISPIRGLRHR
jgi:hypothetical protein